MPLPPPLQNEEDGLWDSRFQLWELGYSSLQLRRNIKKDNKDVMNNCHLIACFKEKIVYLHCSTITEVHSKTEWLLIPLFTYHRAGIASPLYECEGITLSALSSDLCRARTHQFTLPSSTQTPGCLLIPGTFNSLDGCVKLTQNCSCRQESSPGFGPMPLGVLGLVRHT